MAAKEKEDFSMLVDVLGVKFALAKVNMRRNTSYCHLKPKQMMCLKSLMKQQDILAVLPTGYGKSLIFELSPLVLDFVKGTTGTSVIIVSPLDAIMKEQAERFGEQAVLIGAGFFNTPSKELDDVQKGKYRYFIGHPENVLSKEAIEVWRSESLQQQVGCIVVDEAHCVVNWGEDFRKDFLKIQNLRGIFPGIPIMALTATASEKKRAAISEALALKDANVFTMNPDRPNIKICVVRRSSHAAKNSSVEDSYKEVMEPLIKELEEKLLDFPKTVVYTKLKWCGYGHHIAIRPKFTDLGVGAVPTAHVSQYHASCTQEMKAMRGHDFARTDGSIRLLFATEAYSMGADAPDIRRIVHAGPPTNIETYIQEIGRAGRDGLPAIATLYFNNNDLGGNVPGLKDEVRMLCRVNTCRREIISRYFGYEVDRSACPGDHNCCDVCEKTCDCDICLLQAENSATDQVDDANNDVTLKLSDNDKYRLQAILEMYLSAELEELDPLGFLSKSIVATLMENIDKIKDADSIKKFCPDLDQHYVDNVVQIIEQIVKTSL